MNTLFRRFFIVYKSLYFFLISVILFAAFASCGNNATPLPTGYVRIDLPEKEYRQFDTVFPYSFQYPVYGRVIPDTRPSAEPWWADVLFEDFKAVIHLSYKPITSEDELNQYIEDGRSFINRHIPKATGFNEKLYVHEENEVYGMLYEIMGKEAATPLQFHLTDSTNHFLRGSLYFNVTPNNDSLAPVIDFLREDIMLLMESLQWQE